MRWLCCTFFCICIILPTLANDKTERAIELTDEQALSVSDIMINAGDIGVATDLLNDILQSDNVNIRTGALFNLGRIAITQGDYNTAKRYFLTILKWNPGYTRVRVELARCYILADEYANADFQLRLVLGDKNLPPAIAEQVRKMLNYVRQNKGWAISAGLAIVPDSNLNYVSGQKQECVNTWFGPMCRNMQEKEQGIGIKYNLGGEYFLRLNSRFSIRNSLSLHALDFKTSKYDDYSLYIASGPRYVRQSWETSVQAFSLFRWYGGKYYNSAPGARVDINIDLTNRLNFAFGGAYTRTRYKDSLADSLWRNNEYTAYIQPMYYLNNKSFVFFGLEYFDSNTLVFAYGNNGFGYSLGYYVELPWTLNLYTKLDMRHTIYNEEQYFVNSNHELERYTRHDNTYSAYVRIGTRFFETRNIYPTISYTFSLTDSNVPMYEYSKHRVQIEANYRF